MSQKKGKQDDITILRKGFDEFDDDTIRTLTKYYKVNKSDQPEISKYSSNGRSIPKDDAV